MKMKRYIVAAIMAAALLASGCGKFVRDELIQMQNEIDKIYGDVEQLNQKLSSLGGVVRQMALKGYVVDIQPFSSEEGEGYTLFFRTVNFDDQGNIVTDDSSVTIDLLSGVDGVNGADAQPFVLTVKQDEEDGRWYWFDSQANEGEGDWLRDGEGNRYLVDGADGKTPLLKVEEGYWSISWDGGETWDATEWKAKGEDANEVFFPPEIFDDRIELTLAADSTVLILPRYLPVDVTLTVGDEVIGDQVLVEPGQTVAIDYELTGTGARYATLVAGTDGRFKTAIKRLSDTTGVVKVICPEVLPEDGYIYVTVNDGNGRSSARVINFEPLSASILDGETVHAAAAEGEENVMVTFEAGYELEAECVFPEEVEPWITARFEADPPYATLVYDVAPNDTTEARSASIIVRPLGHPAYQVAVITVNQAGKPAEDPGTDPGTDPGEEPGMQFTDVAEGSYYCDAVGWAVRNGITKGMTSTTFEPNGTCTRGQVVTFLWRAAGQPAAEDRNDPFIDVKENAFYYEAVLWAVEQGITKGTSATTFEPETVCSRGQIVTFLYRAYKK